MSSAQTDVKINAHIIGFRFITSPKATPAKEAWDRVSPIIEYLFSTKKVPTEGHNMEINIAAIRAF